MSDPIRVLHFADVHIGMENYGRPDESTGVNRRVLDFLHRMDEMVEYARSHEVDLCIFAGDAFKTRNPDPTYQREFAWRIRDLAELAPVVMLVGNHDLPSVVSKASSIDIYETLAVPNVWVASEYEVRRLSTKRGDVIVGSAPYPIKARLIKDASTRVSVREMDDLMTRQLATILDDLGIQADTLAAGENLPRLLTCHFSVTGAVLSSERTVMLGRDLMVSPGTLGDPRWDYVALGHIHKHQNLTPKGAYGPPIVYSGSLERIDFGEASDVKGFCWIELERDQTQWIFVPVKTRPMIELHIDARNPSDTPMQVVLRRLQQQKSVLADSIVKVKIQLTPETSAQLSDTPIRDELVKCGVFHIAAIQRDIERRERPRLQISPEGLTHEELLIHYFTHQEADLERRERLLELGRDLMRGEINL